MSKKNKTIQSRLFLLKLWAVEIRGFFSNQLETAGNRELDMEVLEMGLQEKELY